MIYREGSASCKWRGQRGMVRKNEELCAISESAGDCETLRAKKACPRGFE